MAEYAGEVLPLLLKDPHQGQGEIRQLLNGVRTRFFGARKVLVNVTGGTTLMGLAAERLANEARRLACPVRRFGLVDPRPGERQDAHPYRIGEVYWLDGEEGRPKSR